MYNHGSWNRFFGTSWFFWQDMMFGKPNKHSDIKLKEDHVLIQWQSPAARSEPMLVRLTSARYFTECATVILCVCEYSYWRPWSAATLYSPSTISLANSDPPGMIINVIIKHLLPTAPALSISISVSLSHSLSLLDPQGPLCREWEREREWERD